MLFLGCLAKPHVVNDRRQHFLGVVAQFDIRHLHPFGYQCLRERREIPDDLFVVAVDEVRQRHGVGPFSGRVTTGRAMTEQTYQEACAVANRGYFTMPLSAPGRVL